MCDFKLKDCSLEEILKWRDTASERITQKRKEYYVLLDESNKLFKQAFKTDNKITSDIKWVRKLNRHLNKRIFPKKEGRI